MSVDKTLTDIYRREPYIEKYEVENILPGHFDAKYPNLVKFLQEYHRSLEQSDFDTQGNELTYHKQDFYPDDWIVL